MTTPSTDAESRALPADWFTPWPWPPHKRSIAQYALDIAAGAAFPRLARRQRQPAGLGLRGWAVSTTQRFVLMAIARLILLPALAQGQRHRQLIREELEATLIRPPTDREITV